MGAPWGVRPPHVAANVPGMKTPSPFRPATLSRAARSLGLPAASLRVDADAGRIPSPLAPDLHRFELDVVRELLMERARHGIGSASRKGGER